MGERFQVREIEGFAISPSLANTPSSRPPTINTLVMDSHDCWRVVAEFSTRDRYGRMSREQMRERVRKLAAAEAGRLNALVAV